MQKYKQEKRNSKKEINQEIQNYHKSINSTKDFKESNSG